MLQLTKLDFSVINLPKTYNLNKWRSEIRVSHRFENNHTLLQLTVAIIGFPKPKGEFETLATSIGSYTINDHRNQTVDDTVKIISDQFIELVNHITSNHADPIKSITRDVTATQLFNNPSKIEYAENLSQQIKKQLPS